MLPAESSLHTDEIQRRRLLMLAVNFKMSSTACNMDNRFPPAEKGAWIILFIVNTGEA